jgi:hypothetical protein
MEFEWDERKAVTNVKKHGVSFHEAGTAEIRWPSPSMIPNIQRLNIDFLHSGYLSPIVSWPWRTPTEVGKYESSARV